MTSPSRFSTYAIILSGIFLVAQIWLVVAPLTRPSPDGTAHLGFPHLPTDHYAYMMYTTQTERDGSVLTRNLFTTSRQDGRFLMIGLVAAGALQKLLPLPDAVVWHGLRIIFLALFCLVLWKMCQAVFHGGRKAIAAHAFVLFSGGIDWLIRPFFRDRLTASGLDWANFIDNPWNFSVFYAATNLVWVIPMTLVTFMVLLEIRWLTSAAKASALRAGEMARLRSLTGEQRVGSFDTKAAPADFIPGVLRGLGFAALWFLHPYSAIVWALLVAVSVLVPPAGMRLQRSIFINLPAALGPTLVGLFILWSQQDPVVAQSNAQTGLWKLGYPPIIYPVVYGPWLLLPLALIIRRGTLARPVLRWLLLWFLAGFTMTLNPLVTGAKFQFSFLVPLLLLEMAGLFALLESERWQKLYRAFPVRMITGFVILASANSIAGLLVDVNPPAAKSAATTTTDHSMMLKRLDSLPEGGVLCDPFEGQLVPWKAGKAVFVGQWFLSTRYMEKMELVRWFYSSDSTAAQKAGFLNAANIRWVLYGPREIEFGKIPTIPGLELIDTVAGRQIWEYRPPDVPAKTSLLHQSKRKADSSQSGISGHVASNVTP